MSNPTFPNRTRQHRASSRYNQIANGATACVMLLCAALFCQVPTTPKISNRLFNKTRKGKRKKETKEEPPPEEEEEMVQDGPSLFKVKPEKVQVKPNRGRQERECCIKGASK